MADEKTNEVADDATKREYIQYMGEEPHGTAFLTTHTIPKGDGLWKRNGVTLTKDVVWERDPLGPSVGQKGNQMLVAVEDLDPNVVRVLEKTPGYKRISA
jgi:hypothetical protein